VPPKAHPTNSDPSRGRADLSRLPSDPKIIHSREDEMVFVLDCASSIVL
jgi:hypothetical protein